jgi:hypothetical protein
VILYVRVSQTNNMVVANSVQYRNSDLHIVCDISFDIAYDTSFDSIQRLLIACMLTLGQHFA